MYTCGIRVLCMKILRFSVALGAVVVGIGGLAGAYGHEASGGGQAVAVVRPAVPELAIVDTDIGDDIDDAFALALALRSPEVKLLGITTAYGDTELRAKLVDRYLNAAACGLNLPVVPGVPTPHSNVFTQAAYASHQPNVGCAVSIPFNKEEDARWARERKHDDAAGFLLDQIRAHPGHVTLIAIGPLVNVEAAIKRDPATFRKLKRVVMMGGSKSAAGRGRAGLHDAAGLDADPPGSQGPGGDLCPWIPADRPVDAALPPVDRRQWRS
jgi:hypothetical protein